MNEILKQANADQKRAKGVKADATLEGLPPIVVVVQGPPKSGKTTLIRALVTNYGGSCPKNPVGPITVRLNRMRRLTFIECSNDLPTMIDMAKVGNVVLSCINAHSMELQTYEFMTLLSVHGFPKVEGILTHLDEIDLKQRNKTQRTLNKAWKKLTPFNHDLIDLSSDYSHGVANVPKIKTYCAKHFLSKSYTPLQWQSHHPYMLVDRVEQLEDPTSAAMYGYVQGSYLKQGAPAHIPGLGDVTMTGVDARADPVPTIDAKSTGMRDKDRLVYAPMANVESSTVGVTEGHTADVGRARYNPHTVGQGLARVGAVEGGEGLGEGDQAIVRLHTKAEGARGAVRVTGDDAVEALELYSDDDSDSDSDSESDSDEEMASAAEDDVDMPTPDQGSSSADYWTAVEVTWGDVTYVYPPHPTLTRVDPEDVAIRNRFVTGEWGVLDRDVAMGDVEAMKGDSDDEEEEEDVDMDEDQDAVRAANAAAREEASDDDDADFLAVQKQKHEAVAERDRRIAAMPEERRVLVEGHRPGTYVRVTIDGVAPQFFTCFDPTRPIIVGGLGAGEAATGRVRTRIIKNMHHRRPMNNNDPAVVSMGWRRFQTQVTLSMEDDNGRQRMIKYTPDHLHCFASFQGPLCPPNYGIAMFKTIRSDKKSFSVTATGTVLQVDGDARMVKKCKLIGNPYRAKSDEKGFKTKTMKNTAFIKGMFNSHLEVQRFIGARIVTVSGIRGVIKKAEDNPPGAFRATFEDKILLSDIVFMRTWTPVDKDEKLCIPVATMLQVGNEWNGIKNKREVRDERGEAIPVNKDSLYKPIERKERVFNPLVVTPKLQAALPFASKPKLASKKGSGYLATREREVRVARGDKRRDGAVDKLHQLAAQREKKRLENTARREERLRAETEEIQARAKDKRKAQLKARYRRQGLNRKDNVATM